MAVLCDLQIHVNGQQTFFLNQKIVSAYSVRLKKMIKHEKKTTTTTTQKSSLDKLTISLEDFPGGPDGFELVSRFCYNNGRIPITVPNVGTLYCAAIYLGMNKKLSSSISSNNLLQQTENFLEEMFYWCWNDVIHCLRSCEPIFTFADSSGLVDRLITTLLAKIAQNSDLSLISSSNNSSSSSSPDLMKLSSPTSANNSNNKAWWFDDLCTLSPLIIDKFIRSLGAYGSDNNSLLLTKFLLQYLKKSPPTYCKSRRKFEYSGLADTAVYGVMLMGKTAFSCRALMWVHRLVSGLGLSRVCKTGLERLIGSVLDSAKLDDLLVSAAVVSGSSYDDEGDGGGNGVYDVNLVVRLIRVFVQCQGISLLRLKKVGWLIDQYLAEISPDHNLKISKFMGVAQSLPDLARDCFDGVYRAIDIYLESHPTLSFDERTRLCRCLNYEKLSLEACKDLAKNPRIPPRVAVQALASQKHVNYEPPTKTDQLEYYCEISPTKSNRSNICNKQIVVYSRKEEVATFHHDHHDGLENDDDDDDDYHDLEEDESCCNSQSGSEDMKLNIQRMQWRVLELEKLCKEMKGQMIKLVRHNKPINSSPAHNRTPRLC